jgi:hypothetical protein
MSVSGLHSSSVVPDVAGIGIDHGEEGADALAVLLHRPVRCPARPESVALIRPAQPVVGGAAVSVRRMANRSPSTSRVNNTDPGLPSVPRYTAGTAGGPSPSPLGLLSTRASIHPRRLRRLSHTRSADARFSRDEGAPSADPRAELDVLHVWARAAERKADVRDRCWPRPVSGKSSLTLR